MQPIHELLARIRWDPEFGQGEFELGILDHVAQEIVRVPLQRISFGQSGHEMLSYYDTEGEVHEIPLHRIKSVYKNGVRIWHRQH